MSTLISQIKASRKTASTEHERAKRRLAKADRTARAAAAEFQAAKEEERKKAAALLGVETSLKAVLGSEEAPKGKPGPKPKAVHAKPGPKVKAGVKKAPAAKKLKVAAKSVKKAKSASTSRAAQGRREVADGKRPPIKDAIIKTLGKRVMHAHEVYEVIKAKGHLPNSADPRGYIGYLLSASKTTIKQGGKDVEVNLFERVHEKGRGFYKNRGVAVSKAAIKAASAPKATKTKKAAPKAEKPAKVAKPVKEKPAKVAAAPAAKAAPAKDGKRTVTCKTCGGKGHNSKGHDRWAKAQAEAGKPTEAKAAPAPKAAADKTTVSGAKDGKRTVTCKVCGAKGHNSKGHARWATMKAGPEVKATTNGHAKVAAVPAPVEPAAAVAPPPAPKVVKAPPADKPDADKTTDELLAEAGLGGESAVL